MEFPSDMRFFFFDNARLGRSGVSNDGVVYLMLRKLTEEIATFCRLYRCCGAMTEQKHHRALGDDKKLAKKT